MCLVGNITISFLPSRNMRNMRCVVKREKDDGLGQHLQRLARDESAFAAALKHVTASTGCFLEMVESVETSNEECTWSGFEPMLHLKQ